MTGSTHNGGWSIMGLASQTIDAARDVLIAREGPGRGTTPFEVGMQVGRETVQPALPAWFIPLLVILGVVFVARKM